MPLFSFCDKSSGVRIEDVGYLAPNPGDRVFVSVFRQTEDREHGGLVIGNWHQRSLPSMETTSLPDRLRRAIQTGEEVGRRQNPRGQDSQEPS